MVEYDKNLSFIFFLSSIPFLPIVYTKLCQIMHILESNSFNRQDLPSAPVCIHNKPLVIISKFEILKILILLKRGLSFQARPAWNSLYLVTYVRSSWLCLPMLKFIRVSKVPCFAESSNLKIKLSLKVPFHVKS